MKRFSAALLVLVAGFVLGGCGSGVSGSGSVNAVADSKGCISGGCHEVRASVVTGNPIGAEWGASTHKAMNVAGCRTCHGHSHQNSCSKCHGGSQLQDPQQNSVDAQAQCLNCHVSGAQIMKGLDYRHIPELSAKYRQYSTARYMSNYSAAGYYTMRGTPYESKCIWCHNPHDNRVLPQHEDWAESGHGSTNSGPFARASTDFKTRGSWRDWNQAYGDVCVRCHTASGYINLVTSGMKDVFPWGVQADGKTPISKTRQTLYCNVCHDNGNGKAYGYNLRQIPAQGATGGIRVYYNYSATTTSSGLATLARARISDTVDYPYVGISDRCLLCHSGRGTGNLIKQAGYSVDVSGKQFNFRNNNRIGMHDFAGGATMFGQAGFEYYSSYRYAGSVGLQHLHEEIGAGYPGTGSRGPCVSCHMSTAKSHEYVPVTLGSTSIATTGTSSVFPSGRAYTVTSIDTSICMTCHSSGQVAAPRFNGTVSALNVERKGYHSILRALYVWLNKKSLVTSSDWLKASTYAWTGAPAYVSGCNPAGKDPIYFGSRNMGASFNYDFLKNDPAGYVHNDLYVKRLVYDTLDWIDDCDMNGSAHTAIIDAGTSALGTAILAPEEVTSALNYLFGVPNVYARPEGNN